MKPSYKTTKIACYITNIAQAAVCSFSPLLFVTFRETYGISYTLLGLLVAINFCTQLSIDLIFTFFSHRFCIPKTIRLMPYLTVLGLLIYALFPLFFPGLAYLGLAVGTVIFSCAAGLAEVLISPLVASLPSDNPERDMTRLHSFYAWGLVGIVIFGSLYLQIFGVENWEFLPVILALIPAIAAGMLAFSPIPVSEQPKPVSGQKNRLFEKGLLLCFVCIFLGAAAEGTMTQWVSSYVETALTLPKIIGDILGMALFAVMLGLGRSIYARYGKSILRFMLIGMVGSVACYVLAGLTNHPIVGLAACAATGFFTSMLWPGSIILVEKKFPQAGVAAYALMAAGGDFGIAVAPQLMGWLTDRVSESFVGQTMASRLSLLPEQIGMRAGLLCAAFFPLAGALVVCVLMRHFKKQENKIQTSFDQQ